MQKQQDDTLDSNNSDFVRIVIFDCDGYVFGLDAVLVAGVRPDTTGNTVRLITSRANNKHTLLLKSADFEYKLGISSMPSLLDVSVTNIYPLPYLLAQNNDINGLTGIAINKADEKEPYVFLIDPYKFST